MAHHSSQEAKRNVFHLSSSPPYFVLESWGGIDGEVGSKEGSQPKPIVSGSGCLLYGEPVYRKLNLVRRVSLTLALTNQLQNKLLR